MKPERILMFATASLLGSGWVVALSSENSELPSTSLWLWFSALAVWCLPLVLWVVDRLSRPWRGDDR